MDKFSSPHQQPPRRAPRAVRTLNEHLAVLGHQLSAVFTEWAVRMESADPIPAPSSQTTPQAAVKHGSPADIASPDAGHGLAQRDTKPELADTVTIIIDAELAEIREGVVGVDDELADDCANVGHDTPGIGSHRDLEQEQVTDQVKTREEEAGKGSEPDPEHEHGEEKNHKQEAGLDHEYLYEVYEDEPLYGHELRYGNECERESEREQNHDEERNLDSQAVPVLREDVQHDHHQEVGSEVLPDVQPEVRREVRMSLRPELRPELKPVLQKMEGLCPRPELRPQTRGDIGTEIRSEGRSGLQPDLGAEPSTARECRQASDHGRGPDAEEENTGAEAVHHSSFERGEGSKRARSWTPEEQDLSSDDGGNGFAGCDEKAGPEPYAVPHVESSGKPKSKRRRFNWTTDESDVFMRTVRANPHLRGMALNNCVGDALGGKRSESQIRRRFRTLRGNGTIQYRVTRKVEWGQLDGPVEKHQP